MPLSPAETRLALSRPSWEQYALGLARAASARSEDPHHKVGAALLRPDMTVASLGYNGAPSKFDVDWNDRDGRRRFVVHAEQNALRYVIPGSVALLASTMMPCFDCVLEIAAYRIPRVVYLEALDPSVYDINGTTELAINLGISMECLDA